MLKHIFFVILTVHTYSTFALSSKMSARDFILSKKNQIEGLVSKSVGLKSKVIFKTLSCLETEGFGEANFGVATCLVDFVDTKGGGKIAINISSDETGSLAGKEISVSLLSSWD